jgi:hypothetical protein
MVDLPRIPRRLVTTEAPTSSVTAADIRSPFLQLGSALTKVGEGLEDISVRVAEEEGHRAVVTTDESGAPRVEMMPLLSGRAGAAYNRVARMRALADGSAKIDEIVTAKRNELAGKPEEFKEWSALYADQLGGNVDATLGDALRRTALQKTSAAYNGLVMDVHRATLARATKAIDGQLMTAADDLEIIARRGGADTDEFRERVQTIETLLSEKVNNPLLGFPKELGDRWREEVMTRAYGAAILDGIEKTYQSSGYEAARATLRNSVQALGTTIKSADKIERQGLAWLRSEEATYRGERDAISREWSAAKGQVATLPPEALDDIEQRANAVGAYRVANDVRVQRAALDITRQLRALPEPERARIAATGAIPAQAFETTLVARESGGRATTVNQFGYAGLYQFGAPRLADLGVYSPGAGEDLGNWSRQTDGAPGKWSGTFNIPGFPEVKSLQDFLASPAAQRYAYQMHQARMNVEISTYRLDRFEGQTVGGVPITREGLYAMLHLGGVRGTRRALESGGQDVARDANGTSVLDYARMGTGANLMASREGIVALGMLKREMGRDLQKRIEGFATADRKFSFPSMDEIATLGAEVAAIGTPEQRQRVAELAAQAEYGAKFRTLPAARRTEIISAWHARMQEGGNAFERELLDKLVGADKAIADAYSKNPYDADVRFGTAAPVAALDFANPVQVQAALADRVKRQSRIRAETGMDAFSLIQPSESDAVRAALTSDPQAANRTLAALAAAPPDIYAATMADLKDTLSGMVRTYEPTKLDAAMGALDAVWKKDAQFFAKTFGEDTMKRLQLWQTWRAANNPAEIAERFKRADDPAFAKAREQRGKDAETEMQNTTVEQLTAAMGKSWTLTPGLIARNVTGALAANHHGSDAGGASGRRLPLGVSADVQGSSAERP